MESKAEKYWDEHRWQTVPIDYWASNPQVQAYINRRTTGNPNTRWLEWVAEHFKAAPLEQGLCLACGAGTAEIHAVSINLCRQMDACDISRSSLEIAREKAESCGVSSRIRYFKCDLNREVLTPDYYDIVLSSGGLHHVENLEHLLGQVEKALKPGGILAVDEYIGPDRLQYSDHQLEIVNRVVESLPEALRTGKKAMRPSLEELVDCDPSEAVRSSEIVELLERKFEILAKRFYGGTIMHVLYASGAIDQRFLIAQPEAKQPDVPSHANLLPPILLLEEMLTELGAIPSDYAVFIARKC